MKSQDYAQDIEPRTGGPLLSPNRPNRRLGHVNNVDWSNAPIAKAYNITGETHGGPRRRLPRAA